MEKIAEYILIILFILICGCLAVPIIFVTGFLSKIFLGIGIVLILVLAIVIDRLFRFYKGN